MRFFNRTRIFYDKDEHKLRVTGKRNYFLEFPCRVEICQEQPIWRKINLSECTHDNFEGNKTF